MGMFDVSEESYNEYLAKWKQMATEKTGEPTIACGPFRRGGAASNMAISKTGLGGIVYAANALRHKQKAGGLPAKVFLVVTPTKLHAFKYSIKGRGYRLNDEAGVWDRPGLKFSTEQKLGLTMLTIESPTEGEKATLAPGGVKDDPFTQEVIRVLSEEVTEVPV